MRTLIAIALAGLSIAGVAAAQPHQHNMDSAMAGAQEALTATPAFAPDGTLWVARVEASRVVVGKSTDLGKTFSRPVSVTPGPIEVDWGPDSRPQIAIDRDGQVIVTYAIFKDKQFNGRVYYTRSTDGGVSFAQAKPITSDDTSQRFQATAIDSEGRLFAAWLDKRHAAAAKAAGKPYPGAALAYAWSDNDGATFGDTHIAIDDTCECCRLSVAMAGPGRPAVLFRNIFAGSVRDHALVTFTGPTTPGPLRRVSVDNWKIEACPHQGPSLAIAPDGSYHAAWFTDGTARQGLFYARADDADAPFNAPRALSSPEHRPERPYLLANGKALHLVWKEFDGTRTRIRWEVSHDSGRSWNAPRTVADTEDASDHPLLVAYKDRTYLSWLTRNEGYRLIPLEVRP
ncbi:MAG TPA: sialidase family protein [Vineibacter sp.]|nr:sialidase family protein [Vineibacter sp.]